MPAEAPEIREKAKRRLQRQDERLLQQLADEERRRVEALLWARDTLLDLRDRAAVNPEDRQIREDATLVATAADELVTGREPRSVTGQIGRATRIPTPTEGALLREIWSIRYQIPRAPSTGSRQPWEVSLRDDALLRYVGLEPPRPGRGNRRREEAVEAAWRDLCLLAELTEQEAEALKLHGGLGWSLVDVARALGVRIRRVKKLIDEGMQKIESFIATRQWGSMEEFISER